MEKGNPMHEQVIDLAVIVPTLNVRKTIRATLDSLAPLRDAGAKIIICDSYSDDGTIEVAAGLYDQILSIPKGNMYAAINAGINAAETKWVSYLNADDIIFADVILATIKSIEPDIDLVYGDLDFIDFHGRFLHSYRFPQARHIVPLAASNICAMSPIGTLFKKSLWEKLNGFDTRYRYSADFSFFLRAALSKCNFFKIANPTVGAFRLHIHQLSQSTGNPGLVENRQIVHELSLQVSALNRLTSLAIFKLSNFREICLRVLRHRHLTNSAGVPECITPPSYQK
jgi:glycosyltransferase involved in cell wall biosynthesis